MRLNYIEERLIKMINILTTIEETQPNLKAKATSSAEEEMLKMEQEVIQKDQEMKKFNDTITHGFRAVVDLNGLSHRLFQKYNSFIQTQVNFATKEKPTLVPKSRLKRDQMDKQSFNGEEESPLLAAGDTTLGASLSMEISTI